MNFLGANWKTTAGGLAAILGALADIAHMGATGQWDGNHLMLDWTAISTGFGLLCAKDSNVTGGSKPQ